ncbi:hypothetical protein F8388_021129 [Cannabis sativa]|nr:hypothetical protein F8388_021129 [Cannabis sativa]
MVTYVKGLYDLNDSFDDPVSPEIEANFNFSDFGSNGWSYWWWRGALVGWQRFSAGCSSSGPDPYSKCERTTTVLEQDL